MKLTDFHKELAIRLCTIDQITTLKRRRPIHKSLKKKKGNYVQHPPNNVRVDGVNHWPLDVVRGQCKMLNCNRYTWIGCSKCRILCCRKNKKGFTDYDTKF